MRGFCITEKGANTVNDSPEILPVAVAEYLRSAAVAIAKEQGFKPSSPDELRLWLEANTEAVAAKAQALQLELWHKMNSPEGKKAKELLSIAVWTEIRHRELISESNAALDKVLWS
jgi:hypothetical protein